VTPGEWPTLMGNNRRTCRSEGKGAIHQPRVAWRKSLGLWEGWAVWRPGRGQADCVLPGRDELKRAEPKDLRRQWEVGGAWYDLSGDGAKIRVPPNQEFKIAKLLPDVKGLQRVESLYTTTYEYWHQIPNHVRVLSYERGAHQPQEVWKTVFPKYHERPHVLVADMNGDGQKDVIVSAWEGILVYQGARGELLMTFPQEKLHSARKRGFVTARDLDGDGLPEIVIIGLYTSHVNVIQNGGQDLSLAWSKMYEDDILWQRRIVRIVTHSVEDYDGDGRYEIVFNLWNEHGDGRWHVKGLDALTGEERFDVAGTFLHDALDADGDGVWEMFCSEAQGLALPEDAPLKVLQWRGGTPAAIWEHPLARWCKMLRHDGTENLATHGAGVEFSCCLGDERVVTTEAGGIGRPAAWVDVPCDGGRRMCAFSFGPEKTGIPATAELFVPAEARAQVMGRRSDGSTEACLLRLQAGRPSTAAIRVAGGRAEVLSWRPERTGTLRMPIVADLRGDGCNEIVIRNATDEIVCLTPRKNGPPVERWWVKGRGQAHQYNGTLDFGAAADDLDGDGRKELLLRRPGKTGAALVAVDCDGHDVWSREFADIQSGDVLGWQGNIAFWNSAHLTGEKGTDVVVAVERNLQHTGQTFGLNGRDGTELWKTPHLRDGEWAHSGTGGFICSAWDPGGDGRDEVLCAYGLILWCAEGRTGRIRFHRFFKALWDGHYVRHHPKAWIAALVPVPIRTSNGDPAYFCALGGNATGLLRGDGRGLVWGNEEVRDGRSQCLADVDGDGRIWVADANVKDGQAMLSCYDPENGRAHPGGEIVLGDRAGTESGRIVSSFPFGHGRLPAAADLDGDRRDEVVVNRGRELVCVDWADRTPRVAWRVPFEEEIGPPVIADVDGDGLLEVLVSDLAGNLHCVDGR